MLIVLFNRWLIFDNSNMLKKGSVYGIMVGCNSRLSRPPTPEISKFFLNPLPNVFQNFFLNPLP